MLLFCICHVLMFHIIIRLCTFQVPKSYHIFLLFFVHLPCAKIVLYFCGIHQPYRFNDRPTNTSRTATHRLGRGSVETKIALFKATTINKVIPLPSTSAGRDRWNGRHSGVVPHPIFVHTTYI